MTPMLTTPAFSDAALKNAGKAALGIGSWIKAIIEYDNAMRIVKPKQAELKIAKEAAAAANKIKEEAEARLAAKEAELNKSKGPNSFLESLKMPLVWLNPGFVLCKLHLQL